MKLSTYLLRTGPSFMNFEFVSDGPRGSITKSIQFTLIDESLVYNLGFGDKHPETGVTDDLAISNNGDSEKVLATVVAAVYAFCREHPGCWVYATGSTPARTRLYRMGISKYLEEITTDFDLYGETDQQWKRFEKNKNYHSFLVKRKMS